LTPGVSSAQTAERLVRKPDQTLCNFAQPRQGLRAFVLAELLFSALTWTCHVAFAATPNTLTAEERRASWQLLFDGKTTTGWRGYNMQTMPPGWKVLDSALVRVAGGVGGKGAGGGDDIITVEQFDNFELTRDWKIVPGATAASFTM
jgi:hypothetical protein